MFFSIFKKEEAIPSDLEKVQIILKESVKTGLLFGSVTAFSTIVIELLRHKKGPIPIHKISKKVLSEGFFTCSSVTYSFTVQKFVRWKLLQYRKKDDKWNYFASGFIAGGLANIYKPPKQVLSSSLITGGMSMCEYFFSQYYS